MRAVFLADLHVGHHVGLADPRESGDRGAYREIQSKFYRLWAKGCRSRWRKPDALVVVGDAIDGQGKKSGGVEAWTTDLKAQATHAATLLSMWNAKQVYVLRGSHYHVTANTSGFEMEEYMAGLLDAEPYPNGAPGQQSGPAWFLTFGDVSAHFSHKVSISRVFAYRSTPIAREMMAAKLNDPLRHYREAMLGETERLHQEYRTRLVVRAHAHYFWICKTSHSEGIDLPCWQALSPYMQTENPLGMPPDIGFVGVEFHGKGRYTTEPVITRVESVQPPPHSIVGQHVK